MRARPPAKLRTRVVLGAPAAALTALLACAPPPASPSAGADPPWLSTVARVCARQVSCAHGHSALESHDPSRCVAIWLAELQGGLPTPQQRCLLQAESCDAVAACTTGHDPRAAAFCASHPGQTTGCDGDALVECGDDEHEAARTPCGPLGGRCGQVRHAGGLTESACISPSLCPATAPESWCDRGAVVLCSDGAASRAPCKAGSTCKAHVDGDGIGRASCEPVGVRCGNARARYCDGERLVECAGERGDGRGFRMTDCEALGLRCEDKGPARAEGEPQSAGCYVQGVLDCAHDEGARCEDDALVFCAFGRRTRVSCKSIGIPGCTASPFTACGAAGAR